MIDFVRRVWALAALLLFTIGQPSEGQAAARPAAAAVPPAAVAGMPPQLVKSDVDTWLSGFIPYALQRGDIAGAVVVVVKDGRVLTARGFGYADMARRRPVDPATTLFRPGSISKLFTWTAVMQLVEQGRIDLDADVNRYLDFRIPPRDGRPVTMRHLLTHTPGFEESVRGLISAGRPPAPLGAALKRWTPQRIYPAGEVPAYSNYGTGLAGYIVERVSGMSFDAYVERNILARIGTERATFRQPLPAAARPFMSAGYLKASEKPQSFEIVDLAPAGSLSASGLDMAKFMIAHLNGGAPLLRPETARMMHGSTLTTLPRVNRMALGFYEQNLNGRRIISHGGDTRQFHSGLWLYLDDGVGLYYSINSTGTEGSSAAIRDALLHSFTDRYFPQAVNDPRVDAATAREHARMMVGNYLVTRRSDSNLLRMGAILGQMSVTLDADGGLVVPYSRTLGGAPRKWVEIEPFVWREVGGTERLAAKVVDGRVVRLSSDALSAIIQFERAPWYVDKGWFVPASIAALLIIAITALGWPIAAISRRVHGARLELAPRELLRRRLLRGFAWLVLVVLGLWTWIFSVFGETPQSLDGGLDVPMAIAQIVGPIALAGLIALAGYTVWRRFAGPAKWTSRIGAVLLLAAALMLGWTLLACGLLGYGLNF